MAIAEEPAFAWYQLQGRESALLLVVSAVFVGLCLVATLRDEGAQPVPVQSHTMAPARVYVNRAEIAELAALPGIGPRKAERILQARATSPITSLEELAKAAGGIPKASLERIAPYVRFEP